MNIVIVMVLAACGFSSALLALRSLRVLYLELSGRDGPADRQTVVIALAMLAVSVAVLLLLAAHLI